MTAVEYSMGMKQGFHFVPKLNVYWVQKGPDIYEVAKGNDKENITVMFSFNAVG